MTGAGTEVAAPPSPAKARSGKVQETAQGERLWIVAIGAIVTIQLWFGMIATSFWLDETGTWWIVKDGAAEAIRRALSWSGQSPLYYLVAWLSARMFGLNEIALRIPSVIAMSGAICFLYRIAEHLYDRTSASFVAFVFLCVASFYAVDARPYALAIFCLTLSMWALIRWLDAPRLRDALLYVGAGTLVVYAHCILALALAAGLGYGVAVLRRDFRRLVTLGTMALAIALLSLPLVSELEHFYATRSAHTFTGLPTTGDLLAGFIPCSLAGAAVLLVWIWMAVRGSAGIEGKCTREAAVLIGAWALFAPLFLFLLPVFGDLRLFVDRYYSSALPGQALLAGGLLSSIRHARARKALVLVLGAASILAQGRLTVSSHGNDDWRTAMQFVRKEASSAPVLMVSPFAEGVDFHSLADPGLREILFAPEFLYGEPARPVRLPHLFPLREAAAMENIARSLKGEPRFFLLNDKPDRSYEMWLSGKLGPQCRPDSAERHFGYVRLTGFTCRDR
ncbi:MAG TPA: glycosyltransferase family 39 protein [Bryobacteraceae bacterium]|nr:glycosyltransferase family 39 protein [Bryobacteraceae bacterium]